MTIPSVMHGLIELDDGKVFELDSPKGAAWLESIGSFRFEPVGDNKPYTVRKEAGKGGDYWYGYRKQNSKLHKKYIGKSSELSTAKLEEIAEALNTPPQPRVTDKVTAASDSVQNQSVTDRVTDTVTVERFTALELQVQLLQESLEALRSELPGKSDAGNCEELPTVTDTGLQIELGNLRAENERLQSEYDKLESEYEALDEKYKELDEKYDETVEWWKQEERQVQELRSELADLKQKSATAGDSTEKAPKILSLIKPWLSSKAPKNLLSKLEEVLEDD